MDKKECDLVMKGGLTSGIVYPPAVLALADEYTFRNIGGTSAGAIAAAATAAAQMGENRRAAEALDSSEVGFAGLRKLNQELTKPGFLFARFVPRPRLRRLWEAAVLFLAPTRPELGQVLSALHGRGEGRTASILKLWNSRWMIVGGAVLALYLAIVVPLVVGKGSWWAFGFSFAFLLVVGAALRELCLGLWNDLKNDCLDAVQPFLERPQEIGYGFCTGTDSEPGGALCDWLHDWFARMAGHPKGHVLTFGELEEWRVKLRMVTTSLSHRQPLGLPFEKQIFLFREQEMREYFPAAVVDHLVRHAYQPKKLDDSELRRQGYYFLPEPQQLPVLFATRLSLSFPILFAAVPLYTPDFSKARKDWKPGPEDLQRCWFNDGGIGCNFPVSMFDSWLPTRPTFGITLGGLPDQFRGAGRSGPGARVAPDQDVVLPRANEFIGYRWEEIGDNMPALGSAIWSTAQNFRDNLQSTLPGSRDRVVEVRLTSSEGGLNLDMPPAAIQAMVDKGERAGALLLKEFRWDYHRWVRLRLLLGELQADAEELKVCLKDPLYRDLFDELEGGGDFPYSTSQEFFTQALKSLQKLVKAFETEQDLAKGAPAAAADMQIAPSLVRRQR
ncbi:MAG: patatin-like phospholipase family protein [Vulcanimicrobiota bacterium]